MAVLNLLQVTGLQVWRHLLSLLPLLYLTGAVAITTPSKEDDSHSRQREEKEKADMLTGLAAGFGFVFGLILCVCLIWCLCCAHVNTDNKAGPAGMRFKSKVSPSPPHSATVRTRSSTASSP